MGLRETRKIITDRASVMDRLRLRAEEGFTLIELLVVIAIIGIMVAITIPQFAAYRKRVYTSTEASCSRVSGGCPSPDPMHRQDSH